MTLPGEDAAKRGSNDVIAAVQKVYHDKVGGIDFHCCCLDVTEKICSSFFKLIQVPPPPPQLPEGHAAKRWAEIRHAADLVCG